MAEDCIGLLAANIVKNCDLPPKKGIEAKGYAYNRNEVDITYDVTDTKLITAITPKSTFKGFAVYSFDNDSDAGHSYVEKEGLPNVYLQSWNSAAWFLDSAGTQNIDNMDDLIVVIEGIDKNVSGSGDGTFKAYGVETGLWKNADDHKHQENSGARLFVMQNKADQESTVSAHVVLITDLATTRIMLEASLSVT